MGIENWLALQAVAFLWIIESLHESLLLVGFAWLVYSLPMRPGLLGYLERPFFPQLISVPIIWIFMQWVVAPFEAFLGIPIDQLAYSQFKQTALIQITKLAGPGSIDFLIVMVNVAVAACLLELPKFGQRAVQRVDLLSPRVGALLDLGVALLLVLSAVAWGNFELKKVEGKLSYLSGAITTNMLPRTPIAVLQNNITIEEKHLQTTTPTEIAQLYNNLKNNLGVGLLVLPEGVINPAQMLPGNLLTILKGCALHEKKEIVFGCIESNWLASYQNQLEIKFQRQKKHFLRTKETRLLSSACGQNGLIYFN